MALVKKVEIRGFKSLGGKTSSLQLDQGLTAITGPNGSGKSNIFDAIAFCLGESSPKVLRVNKLTSLLYDGGPSGRRPPSTRVTLTFENFGRKIPVDTDTVTISRELRLNGDNLYYLNGKRVQKTTLTDMLSIALMDPRGIQIVPQGMVMHTSELSPDEKRGVIEELVGVAQFDERKAEAMKQLRDADLKLQVASARIGEIKTRVYDLEGERNNQLRLKQMEDEVRWLRAVLASKNYSKTGDSIKDQNDSLKDLSTKIEQITEQLDDLTRELSGLEEDKRAFLSNVVEGASGRQYEVQYSIAKAKSEVERLRGDISEANKLIRKLDGSIPQLGSQREDQAKVVRSVHDQIVVYQNTIKDLEEKKRGSEKELNRIERQRAKLEKQLTEGNARVARMEETISRYSDQATNSATQIESLKNRQSLSAERMKALEEKSKSFLETLQELEGSLDRLEKLRKTEIESFENTSTSLSSISERRAKLEQEVAKAFTTLDRAGQAVLRYDTQKSVAERIASDEIGLKKIEELAGAGALEGVIGRLDRLIRYESRYEKAFMTVGRRWMKAVVVSDFDSMLKLIETSKRLKVTGVGVIPLSEVSKSTRATSPSIDGVIGVMSDLVTLKDGVEGVVNFVFGDTVLTESTEVAYTVSSSGFRAVTLSGDIFEPEARAFESGYLGGLEEIARLVEDAESFSAVKSALNSLRKIIEKRKSDLTQLEKDAKRLDRDKIERSLMVERLGSELEGVTKFVAKYRRLRKALDIQTEKIRNAEAKANRQIERLSVNRAELQLKIERTKAKIQKEATEAIVEERETSEAQRDSVLSTIEILSSQIRDAMTELAKHQGNLEHSLQPSLSRLEEQVKQSKRDLANKGRFSTEGETRLGELNSDLRNWQREEKGLLRSSKKSKPILEGYDVKLKRLKDRENGLRRSLGALEKEQVGITKRLERTTEIEQGYLSELTLYGYSGPIEFFDEAEILLNQMNNDFESLRGRVNLLANKNYREVFTGYKNLSMRSSQLDKEKTAIVKFIEGIDAEKRKVFIEAYEKIDKELRIIFERITKGSAWLELEKPDDIFSGGVFLMTQFLDKNPRESAAVSGGEKTVSALSFILAIQSVYPSPFYLFDEIDAHLDAVNAENLAALLKEKAARSQIIVVTLKDAVLAQASTIYGLYMGNGVSQTVRYTPEMEVTVRHA